MRQIFFPLVAHFSLSSLLSHLIRILYLTCLHSYRISLFAFISSVRFLVGASFFFGVVFIPFIYVVFIKPLWRLPPHSVLTTMWIYRIYKQSFSSCFRYLIIIYYQYHWNSVLASSFLCYCMYMCKRNLFSFFFYRSATIILRACVNIQSVCMKCMYEFMACVLVSISLSLSPSVCVCVCLRARWKHVRC